MLMLLRNISIPFGGRTPKRKPSMVNKWFPFIIIYIKVSQLVLGQDKECLGKRCKCNYVKEKGDSEWSVSFLSSTLSYCGFRWCYLNSSTHLPKPKHIPEKTFFSIPFNLKWRTLWSQMDHQYSMDQVSVHRKLFSIPPVIQKGVQFVCSSRFVYAV